MSFAEKITKMMERPGDDPNVKDDVPWWMKYAGRGLGTVGSFIAIIFGLFNCSSILLMQVDSFLSGALQIIIAVLVTSCEAPCCCMFIDHVQRLSDFVEHRPSWNRAVAYCGLAIVPLLFRTNFSSLIGCGLIFGTGIIYGMMALGRKASAEDMRAAAAREAAQSFKPPVSMRDNLVTNAQPIAHAPHPIGFVGSPFDSNV